MEVGIFNDGMLEEAMGKSWICKGSPNNIQPASFDLTLAGRVWVRDYQAPFLKKDDMEPLKLSGLVLERNRVYVMELVESLNLPKDIYATFSTKSSIGRLGILVKVITEEGGLYNKTSKGYRGKLYIEIMPLAFDIRVSKGMCLVQGRLTNEIIVVDKKQMKIDTNNCYVSISTNEVLDLRKHSLASRFFDLIHNGKSHLNILKNELCLVASDNTVNIPLNMCADVVDFNTFNGEYRTHFAGFIDPGFEKAKIVLEIFPTYSEISISGENSFFEVEYYKLTRPAVKPYGLRNNNYQNQGLKLSKYVD